jgi:uncharacterized protein YcbK (DUF882 family)
VQLWGGMLVTVGHARTTATLLRAARVGLCGGVAVLTVILGAESLQNATANGDTRTISFHHIHLKEDTTVTFKVNGKYDQAALQKINQALRDWRTGQPTTMDPHLIDALWEVYRATGAKEPIHVIGGYRSPATNAMLRRRSSGVAKFSQHMLGKAIDFYIPGVELEAIRDAGLRVQRGGVGFYPSSGSPFVHMDVGSVRHWPRLPEAQLARIMSRGPQVASNNPSAQKQKSKSTVVAARNVRDEDEDAEVTARPTSRSAVPMPKSRPGAVPEPAQSGFDLASASSQPVPSRQAPEPQSEPAGFSLASTSSQHVPAAPRPSQAASLMSANDIIKERGYWEGLTDNTPERPVPPAEIPEARTAAAEAPVIGGVARGSLAPWPMPDRAGRDALAYAAPVTDSLVARPSGKARVVGRVPAAQQNGTAKPAATRPAMPAVKIGERFNNPWMRAMIVSPSAINFMHTSLYGAPDTASLKPHLQKPTATVMMTFSDDPYLGMSSEQFRGNAVVFVATVTFRQRTAALH